MRVQNTIRPGRSASELESELETVFEVVADGLAITNAVGQIVQVNAVGREILGIGPIDDPQSRRSLADAQNPLLQAVCESTPVAGLEIALSTSLGRRVVELSVSPLSSDPASRAAVAVFRDVTRERQLEQELREKTRVLAAHVRSLEEKGRELERATKLKSEFLANMSHELRTPLNAVIGFAEVLLDGTYGTLATQQTACTNDILDGGRHLLMLINDILDLSKIEAGKMEMSTSDHDLSDVVGQAITFVRPQAQKKTIHLHHRVAPDAHIVHCDPDRLRQVLVNLLSNAVKFTGDGGRVEIVAEAIGDKIRISVTDTGIGIADEHRDRIFHDFSQVDGSITRKFGGTGLGLAISRRLVELQGGEIDFESKLGVGSRFFFTVPCGSVQEHVVFSQLPVARRSSSAPARKSLFALAQALLIVDEDPVSARLVGGILREAGYACAYARSCAEMRTQSLVMSFEAAIIDPRLSADTASAVYALATDLVGRHRIVALTQPGERTASADVTLAKPIDSGRLLDAVQRVLDRDRVTRRVLLVDADPFDGPIVATVLEEEGFEVERVTTLAAAHAALGAEGAMQSLAIIEVDCPDGDGVELVHSLISKGMPVMVLTRLPIDDELLERCGRQVKLVAAKGSLSRSAFARHVAAAVAERPRRPRILAVDDNEQNLRLVGAILARRDFEVLEARDARSAIAIAHAERPDAILMDVMLPDVDGLTATRKLKADAATRNIPVIAITAQVMAGDEGRARDAGCCDYVAKPIDPSHLLGALDRALSHRTSAPVSLPQRP